MTTFQILRRMAMKYLFVVAILVLTPSLILGFAVNTTPPSIWKASTSNSISWTDTNTRTVAIYMYFNSVSNMLISPNVSSKPGLNTYQIPNWFGDHTGSAIYIYSGTSPFSSNLGSSNYLQLVADQTIAISSSSCGNAFPVITRNMDPRKTYKLTVCQDIPYGIDLCNNLVVTGNTMEYFSSVPGNYYAYISNSYESSGQTPRNTVSPSTYIVSLSSDITTVVQNTGSIAFAVTTTPNIQGTYNIYSGNNIIGTRNSTSPTFSFSSTNTGNYNIRVVFTPSNPCYFSNTSNVIAITIEAPPQCTVDNFSIRCYYHYLLDFSFSVVYDRCQKKCTTEFKVGSISLYSSTIAVGDSKAISISFPIPIVIPISASLTGRISVISTGKETVEFDLDLTLSAPFVSMNLLHRTEPFGQEDICLLPASKQCPTDNLSQCSTMDNIISYTLDLPYFIIIGVLGVVVLTLVAIVILAICKWKYWKHKAANVSSDEPIELITKV